MGRWKDVAALVVNSPKCNDVEMMEGGCLL